MHVGWFKEIIQVLSSLASWPLCVCSSVCPSMCVWPFCRPFRYPTPPCPGQPNCPGLQFTSQINSSLVLPFWSVWAGGYLPPRIYGEELLGAQWYCCHGDEWMVMCSPKDCSRFSFHMLMIEAAAITTNSSPLSCSILTRWPQIRCFTTVVCC